MRERIECRRIAGQIKHKGEGMKLEIDEPEPKNQLVDHESKELRRPFHSQWAASGLLGLLKNEFFVSEEILSSCSLPPFSSFNNIYLSCFFLYYWFWGNLCV